MVGYRRPMQTAVIIPALNEEVALPLVLDRLPPDLVVIVVDNGSVDRTAEVAEERGAEVLFEPKRGYGNAVQAGLRHLAQSPPDIVVIADADGSDALERMDELLDPIRHDRADFGERRAYVLSDAGTFLAFQERIELESLLQPAPSLRNVYSVVRVDPERLEPTRAERAAQFESFMLDAETQTTIAEFGRERFGRPLFRPLHLDLRL